MTKSVLCKVWSLQHGKGSSGGWPTYYRHPSPTGLVRCVCCGPCARCYATASGGSRAAGSSKRPPTEASMSLRAPLAQRL